MCYDPVGAFFATTEFRVTVSTAETVENKTTCSNLEQVARKSNVQKMHIAFP